MLLSRRHFALQTLGSSLIVAAAQEAPEPVIAWQDVRKLTVEGLGFKDVKSPFDRLPGRAEGVVRKVVWELSRDSAGVAVRFRANTPLLRARWTRVRQPIASAAMSGIATSGLDLYTRQDGTTGPWRWLASGSPANDTLTTDIALVRGLPKGEREYLLYLPLRNAVTSVELGIPKDGSSTLLPAPPRPDAKRKPIVFYGTSITHGASASRPGMTHVAMLGRMFDRPVMNLGFAGNGKMEPEVQKFLVEIDAAVFVVDCLPNMVEKEVRERAEACVRQIRTAHPSTPILLVEDRNYADGFLIASRRQRNQTSQAALREAYRKMKVDKISNLYYLEGSALLDAGGEDTSDGSHPSDLGFLHQAKAFERVLRTIPVLAAPK